MDKRVSFFFFNDRNFAGVHVAEIKTKVVFEVGRGLSKAPELFAAGPHLFQIADH